MGWIEDQIKMRIKQDEELFEDACLHMANVVMNPNNQVRYDATNDKLHTALMQICGYYHVDSSDEQLQGTDTMEILDQLYACTKMMKRSIELKENWYQNASGAMLAFNHKDEPVALLPYKYRGYYYLDTVSKKEIRITKHIATRFQSKAYCFYKPLPVRAMTKSEFITFLKQQISRTDAGLVVAIMLVMVMLGMFTPMVNAYIFSKIIEVKQATLFAMSLITLVSISAASLFLQMIRNVLIMNIETKVSLALESALMMRVFQLPTHFFRKFNAGDVAARIENITEFSHILISIAFTSCLSVCFSVLYVVQMMYYAPTLCNIALVFLVLQLLVLICSLIYQTKLNRLRYTAENKELDLVYALLSGIQKIKNSGAEKRAFAKWAQVYEEHAITRYRPHIFIKITPILLSVCSFIVLILFYKQAFGTGLASSEFIAFQSAYGMISVVIVSLSQEISQLSRVHIILEQIEPILITQPESNGKKPILPRINGGIEMNHVSFRYDEHSPYLFDDISLKIRSGQYIGIVGTTGCGKSTFLRLLLGFEKAQRGAIYYDGKDMNMFDIASLRKKIGVVLQDGKLFQGDIYSNITISAPWLSLEDAWEAAEKAGLQEDILQMPMRMFTLLSEGNGGISGGQRQRLLIARAIAPKPKILLFDEATSALDNITQKHVSDALKTLKCTRIVIAHRLSTIQECDRILVLDHGKFVEDGTYQELIAKQGMFAKLVERQQI